jgi:hypothetical protein
MDRPVYRLAPRPLLDAAAEGVPTELMDRPVRASAPSPVLVAVVERLPTESDRMDK